MRCNSIGSAEFDFENENVMEPLMQEWK